MVEYTLNISMLRPEVLDYICQSGLLDDPVCWKETEFADVFIHEFRDVSVAEEWNTCFSNDVSETFSDRPFYLFYISAKA